MPKLPQAADFGTRPSLRTNRVDMPGTADLATGEALSRAAGVFTKVVGERKEKKDRLNYSLAKNELMQADIANREKLKGDEDYKTHDKRYSEGYNTTRDEIYGRYELTADDGAILDAESDLIRERGRVQVGDAAHTIKRDNEQTAIEDNLAKAREAILSLDPASANDLMLSQLDSIQAGVEAGIYTDAEGLALSQGFVQDTATARLISMDVEERIKALEQSLTKRKAAGAISMEDIKAGKGTGSIADFVNRDTAQKMLDASKAANETDIILEGAYGAVDAAWDLHPEPENWKERDAMIREATKGMPDGAKIRKEADIMHRARTASANADEEAGKDVEFEKWSDEIYDGTKAYWEIPGEALEYMGARRTNALRNAAEATQHRDGFGEFDDSDTEHEWMTMTQAEKMETNLNTAAWKPKLTHGLWSRMLAEQTAYKDAAAKPGKDPNIYGGDNADEVLRDILTGPNALFDRVPKPDTDEARRYSYLSRKVDRALKDESLDQYAKTGSGKLLPQQIDEITAKVVGKVVYIDDWGGDTKLLSADLTEEQRNASDGEAFSKDIYIKIEAIRNELPPNDPNTGRPMTDTMGNAMNMEDYLRNLAKGYGNEVSTRTIERAYFLWVDGDTAGAKELLQK